MAMSTIRLPPQPRRVLFHHDSQLNKHVLWTQDFGRTRGWSTPEERDISMAISLGPPRHGTPSASITRWAFSHPNQNHFIFVTQLTLSNYDNFNLQDILTVLDSVPRLEELQLCRVNIVDNTTGPLVRPPHMVRSLKLLALEACNITEGLPDAHYDLLFRFLSLFERIDRLRLLATIFRQEHLFYSPNFYNLHLPTILHLEAEGFFAYVLVQFFREGYPVRELVSLHLSRCFASWGNLYWIEALVRIVSPTLTHFAFRPNLTASTYGVDYDRKRRNRDDCTSPLSYGSPETVRPADANACRESRWDSDCTVQSPRHSASAPLSGSWSWGCTRTTLGTVMPTRPRSSAQS